ncbi:MAG: hypothetical protein K0U98_22225 [Deltaproteobacteria bacterium]|nr:hypothetical protein [Deltaproteobacteria bacterium]
MAKIALAEMVGNLRTELQEAAKAGEGEDLQFALEEVTLEAEVEVVQEAGAKGGFKFWVVEAGASGKVSQGRTQKISLRLKPKDLGLLSA